MRPEVLTRIQIFPISWLILGLKYHEQSLKNHEQRLIRSDFIRNDLTLVTKTEGTYARCW
jgi:hypothetical protein